MEMGVQIKFSNLLSLKIKSCFRLQIRWNPPKKNQNKHTGKEASQQQLVKSIWMLILPQVAYIFVDSSQVAYIVGLPKTLSHNLIGNNLFQL